MRRARNTEPRRLITAADLEAAIAWRLDGLDRAKLATFATLVKKLPVDLCETHPAVARMLRELDAVFLDDRREAWTLLCAIAALACQNERSAVFWTAGMVAVGSHRKSRQKPVKSVCDSLSLLIAQFQSRHPNDTASEAFEHFAQIAEMGGDEVLADYNPDRDALVFQPYPNREALTEIKRDSFYRRYRRIAGRPSDITIADVRMAA